MIRIFIDFVLMCFFSAVSALLAPAIMIAAIWLLYKFFPNLAGEDDDDLR